MSHYDLVVWEKGDDYVLRRPGQPGQTGQARAAIETELAMRDFLNEGGKLFYSGQSAGRQDTEAYEFRNFGFPEPDEAANGPMVQRRRAGDRRRVRATGQRLRAVLPRCVHLRRRRQRPGRGRQPIRRSSASASRSTAASSRSTERTRPRTRSHTATLALTSSILDPELFPWYADSRGSWPTWQRPTAGPFAPYSGQYYMSAGADSQAFKRLRRTIDMSSATSGSLSFKFSADLEPDWDYMAVEVREVGTENWTTLPGAGGDITKPGAPGRGLPGGLVDRL